MSTNIATLWRFFARAQSGAKRWAVQASRVVLISWSGAWFESQRDHSPDRFVFVDQTWVGANRARGHRRCRRASGCGPACHTATGRPPPRSQACAATGMVALIALDAPINRNAFPAPMQTSVLARAQTGPHRNYGQSVEPPSARSLTWQASAFFISRPTAPTSARPSRCPPRSKPTPRQATDQTIHIFGVPSAASLTSTHPTSAPASSTVIAMQIGYNRSGSRR